ncbi:phosphotransferase family protein [Larkinella knui]|uniref:Phosphotransferase family protein n=1 Tax=Larkinella knui TaxID=2025310 RepID=A0A3P1CG34_9BACT|nr:phosphotransferase family protein [Larkinella knui]RRB12323.1 phosphotransferase family protein [Larkinella knui]
MAELTPDSATSIRPGEELDLTTLTAFLNDAVPGFGMITACGQFPGGYSNLTYLLKTGSQEYVLRRPPFGATIKGGHDMGREFRVLSLLQSAGYPKIPEPVAFCDDESVLGCPFYIMKRVSGIILRAQTAPKMSLSEEIMRRASESLVDNLVQLHALAIQNTGLVQLGKPEGYIRRQVEGWHRRYLASQTDDLPDMDELARWLTAHLPPENPPTLLHNDYKYDNVVLNPDDLTDIRAVLDWEMCTVGDPLMDVGTALSYWAERNDGPFEKSFNLTWLPGNLTRQEFADRYAEGSGRDLSTILYYYIFGLFKNSVVIQQIYSRYQKGLTQDPRFAGLLAGVRALARKGAQSIEHHKMI